MTSDTPIFDKLVDDFNRSGVFVFGFVYPEAPVIELAQNENDETIVMEPVKEETATTDTEYAAERLEKLQEAYIGFLETGISPQGRKAIKETAMAPTALIRPAIPTNDLPKRKRNRKAVRSETKNGAANAA